MLAAFVGVLLAWGIGAFSLFLLRADLSLQAQWPSELEGRVLRLQVRIENSPIITEKAWRFEGRIKALSFPGGQAGADALWKELEGERIRLRLYYPTARSYLKGNYHHEFSPEQLQESITLRSGRILEADIKLKSPRGLHNIGAGDYQARLLSQSIVAVGYIKKLHRIDGSAQVSVREKLGRFIDGQPLKQAPLIKGLLLGDRSGLKQEHWSLLQQTGTGHLLAISGLHIGLAAALGMLFFGGLGRIAQLFSERLPSAQSWALWGGGVMAFAYACLADFSLPTQRALLMLWVYLLAAISAHSISPWRVWLLALLLLLFVDPWALEQAGGCLSFAAVAALIYGYWSYTKAKRSVAAYSWQLLRSQLLIASFLSVLLCYLQLPSGRLSLPANLLAIPWLSFVIMPLLLLFCLSWFVNLDWQWPLRWADTALDVLWFYLQYLLDWREDMSSLLNAYFKTEVISPQDALWWPGIAFSAWSLALMFGAALLFWLPKGFHGRLLFLLPVLGLLFPSSLLKSHADYLQLTVLDVGQGLAVLIEKDDRAVLYDTGPRYSVEHNAGASVVAPFLRRQGLHVLDHLMISHGDSDHSGGLESLLAQFRVGTLWAEPTYLQKVNNQKALGFIESRNACQAGKPWFWQGVEFQWLWPRVNLSQHSAAKKDNNRSCVLLIRYQNLKILLPGDIERWAEKEILKASDDKSDLCNLDVLLLPHHGSHSSSHKAWAACTRPAIVISSTAWQNAYGHPSAKVLRRYPQSLQFDTGKEGAIQLRYGPNKSGEIQLQTIVRSRLERKRYWHRDDEFAL
nr:DNA internalization-related competence protein ComEC/Rec2 [Pseudoteredinibacter isoporae]